MRTLPFALLLLLPATPACHRQKTESLSTRNVVHVPGTLRTDEVLASWQKAGLAPETFTPVEPTPNGAAFCEHGKVRGVDTLLCEYTSEASLVQGIAEVKQGWERVDAHTGVVLRKKLTTLVVVDRERREPSGKTIREMTKIFGNL